MRAHRLIGFTVYRVKGLGCIGVRVGYSPHTVTVNMRLLFRALYINIYPDHESHSTVTGCGQYPSFTVQGLGFKALFSRCRAFGLRLRAARV